ncbi:MAG: cytochrome c biogenesis protein CcsA [Acidimicrobiia bacterium]
MSRRLTAVLGVLTAATLALLVLFGLFVSPADALQGDAVRLFYLHVPAAWTAYLAFGVTTLASVLYLWRRTRSPAWDTLAGASAELGVLFTGLTLVLGSLWGRPVWGVWWAWDARIVSTAVLFFLYLGYLALRQVAADPAVRAKRCAIAALAAFVDVPVVHFSVEWWRTLHQQATVFNPELNPTIEGSMASALLVGVLAFTLTYLYLLERRYRLAMLEEGLEERALQAAIAERRSEADDAGDDTVPVGSER